MSLASLSKDSFTVWRKAVGAGSAASKANVGTVQGMLQPMSATAAQVNRMAFARAFTIFLPGGANVQIGDQLIHNVTGAKYNVQGARNNNFGSQPNIEVTAQLEVAKGQI